MSLVNSVTNFSAIVNKSGICEKFRISKLGIFGSFARGEKSNDIDLLIEDPLTLEEALDLKIELEELLQTPVDPGRKAVDQLIAELKLDDMFQFRAGDLFESP